MSDIQGTTGGVMKPGPDSLALVGGRNSPPPPPQQLHQVLQGSSAYNAGGAAFFRMVSGGGASFFSLAAGSSGSGGQHKRKGRPRRYGPDGAIAFPASEDTVAPPEALLQLPAPPPQVQVPPPSKVAPPPSTPIGADQLPSPSPAAKKPKGRPRGSSNKKPKQKIDVMGFKDLFNPQVLYVHPGEDVSLKIMSVTHHGRRDICVMSANGHISNVMIRQPAIFGGTVSYEGRFEILSLSGSFLLAEVGGRQTRTGGLNVSLAGPDGRIFGGAVAGLLIAASPVQLVVGSFRPNGRKELKPAKSVDASSSAPPRVHPGGAPGASSPPSRGTLSESSGGSGSPLDPPTGFGPTSNGQGMTSTPRQ